MNQTSLESEAPAPVRRGKLAWFPLVMILGNLALLAVLWGLPPDALERGWRIQGTVLLAALTVVDVGIWFFFLSRIDGKLRAVVGCLTLLICAGFAGSVRRIEFTGDMIPILDFYWLPDRDQTLARHRASARPAAPPAVDVDPAKIDFPQYRGVQRDGVVGDSKIARDWQADPPKTCWRQPIGGGYAAFALHRDFAVTIEQRRDKEALVAYDPASGSEKWIYEYPALFHETLGGDGPRATPTIHEDRVYSLGATGELVCLSLADGREHWRTNLLEDNHVGNIDWGMCGSPLVVDDLVVVNPGVQKGSADSKAVWAMDRLSGKVRWKSGAAEASYASPMLVELAGVRQILIFDAVGLAGYDPKTGEELWRFPWETQFKINAAQPIALPDSQVLLTSSSGAAVYEFSKTGDKVAPKEVWRNRSLKASFANPVFREGYVYGLDDGILACIDAKTGKRLWKGGRYGAGQLLLVGDLLVVLTEKGDVALVEASPKTFRELGQVDAIDGRTWNTPALSAGVLWVRNHLEAACLDLRPLADRKR